MSRFPSSNPRPPGRSDDEGNDPWVDAPAPAASEPIAPVVAPVVTAPLPRDATHDRRAVELRTALASLTGNPGRCAELGAALDPAVPGSVVADAVYEMQAWRPDRMRDEVSAAEAEFAGGGGVDDVIAREAGELFARRRAAWERAAPLLSRLRDDEVSRAVTETLGEFARPHVRAPAGAVADAVDAALSVVAAGPVVVGSWPVEATVASIAGLVAQVSLQFLLSPDAGLARSVVREGRPGAFDPASALPPGQIGPLARTSNGRMVTRPFRSGGVVVLGPPGVGKTALLKAVMATFRGSLVVSTNKPGDLLDVVATRLDAPIVSMDPSGSALVHPAVQPVRYDPIDRLDSFRAALSLAEVMVRAQNPAGAASRDRFFLDHAERLVGALMWWAKLTSRDAAAAARALGDINRVARDLRASGAGDEAFDIVRGVAGITEVTRSGILAQSAQVMKAWAIERPAWRGLDRLDCEGLIRAGGTLLLGTDGAGPADDNLVVTAALDEFVTARFALASACEPVAETLLLLDECANTAPHHRIPSWTSTGPGRGVNTMLLFQDLSNQMMRVWGPGGAEILNNAATMIVYPGVTDPVLRQMLSGLAVRPLLGVNPVDVAASASIPAPPPGPGTVYVVDEFADVTVAGQVRFHEEPSLVWAAVEAEVRSAPAVIAAISSVARRVGWQLDIATPTVSALSVRSEMSRETGP